MNKYNKLKTLSILLFSVLLLTFVTQTNILYPTKEESELSGDIIFRMENHELKSSEVITSLILINGSATGIDAHNWSWAKDQGYVSRGNGTQENPYVIENLEIDCQNSHAGVVIVDSREEAAIPIYFTIRNNRIYNVGAANSHSAGIKLYRTQHGTLENNEISSTRDGNYGIHIVGTLNTQNGYPFQWDTSKDINVTNNNITNTERGIYIETGCEDIIVSNNTATSNSLAGIYINRRCLQLTITNNLLSDNNIGIADSDSNNHEIIEKQPDPAFKYGNIVKYNTITENAYGYYLAQSRDSTIGYNNISLNTIHGMYISGSSWNEIANNTIEDNQDRGILMVMGPMGCFRNDLYKNRIAKNYVNAEELTSAPPFIVYDWNWMPTYWENNWSVWESTHRIGNKWGDYNGTDVDDDAIGDDPYLFTGNSDPAPIFNDGIEGRVIFINDSSMPPNPSPFNWSWASQRFWCTGTGMVDDPYVIGPNEYWDGVIDAWGNDFGISIVQSFTEEFRIEGLTIMNATQAGINLYDVSMQNVIWNNTIIANLGDGMHLEAVRMLNISENVLMDNDYMGISLTNNSGGPAMKNHILDNQILNSGIDGIYIAKNTDETNITGNMIQNSGRYGININETDRTISGGCNDTLVYNNILEANLINANDNGTNTDWYLLFPGGYGRGNEWDDYIGTDSDDDGIGDLEYDIGGFSSSEDKFPIYNDGLEETALYIDAMATGVGAHNWTWASRRLFVSGTGQMSDPYIIQNVRFSGADTTSAITIKNSNMVYFKIINCTLDDIGDTDSGSAGIYLYDTDNGQLTNNTFSTNRDGNYGIFLDKDSDRINVTDNNIESSNPSYKFKYGIYLDNSGLAALENIIDSNIIRNNEIGIFITNMSNENNITTNEITDNTEAGIKIEGNSGYNGIYYNDILRNGKGILILNASNFNYIIDNEIKENLEIGLYINTTDNKIYYNIFDNPLLNAQDDSMDPPNMNEWYNSFDMPFKGNYWSNYTKSEYSAEVIDADDDGIGDIQYNISGTSNAIDFYPLYDDGHNGSRVIIDGSLIAGEVGSWQWVADRTWCTGSGTIEDPYIISGLVINGQLNGSCIYIHDSNNWNQNFVIRDCILYNSSATMSPQAAGGILLERVINASIMNCSITNNNGSGIILKSGYMETEETANVIIKNNTIQNNNGSGIFLNGSYVHDTLIENNTILSNGVNGITLINNAFENTIRDCSFYNNTEIGISIVDFQPMEPTGHWEYPPPDYTPVWVMDPWNKNYIFNNTITLGKTGIGIQSSKMIEITGNIITQTKSNGIAIKDIDNKNITISENLIYANTQYGINFGWNLPAFTINNSVVNNNISNNGDTGIILQQCYESTFSDNIIEQNSIGIGLAFLNSYNTFKNNLLVSNLDRGLAIFDLSCEENKIYGNNFTNNGINGEDLGLSNQWCINTMEMKAGNYWDDYDGNDTDDNYLGDTAYANIGGFMNPKDYFPIWWDAPVIKVANDMPQEGKEYGEDAPFYNIQIEQGIGMKFWYDVNGTFSPIMEANSQTLQGKIANNIWESFSNGTLTLNFYVNDSRNQVDTISVEVSKLVEDPDTAFIGDTSPTLIAAVASAGGAEEESGLPWWLQAVFTGMISASAGLVIKISYSTHKRRKELYRKIGENFNKIENIEKFLQEKLGFEEWQKLQDAWQKYKKNEISQKELIKSGRKRLGKRFMDIFISGKR
ncbi:MAG: hypothetical protein BAJALOKI1v1_990006 [Promethearchaeota archaeon]|nr:MAG: hypothetical protein BAJALOKI1v1_990006 [Candidatus Lokiarchaeota archaeon]